MMSAQCRRYDSTIRKTEDSDIQEPVRLRSKSAGDAIMLKLVLSFYRSDGGGDHFTFYWVLQCFVLSCTVESASPPPHGHILNGMSQLARMVVPLVLSLDSGVCSIHPGVPRDT